MTVKLVCDRCRKTVNITKRSNSLKGEELKKGYICYSIFTLSSKGRNYHICGKCEIDFTNWLKGESIPKQTTT